MISDKSLTVLELGTTIVRLDWHLSAIQWGRVCGNFQYYSTPDVTSEGLSRKHDDYHLSNYNDIHVGIYRN